jgi:tetratricopeptide (TPR) repeat protein
MPDDDRTPLPRGDWPEWVNVFLTFLALVVAIWGLYFTYHQYYHHDLTPELEKQYAAKLRQAYQDDLRLDSSEAEALDKFVADNYLNPSSVNAVKSELMSRIGNASQNINRGLDLARQKNFMAARQEFLSATQSDPENSAAWADLGAADIELGRMAEGRSAYDKALVLAPEDWRTRFNFGLFYARVKNPEAALEQFQQVFHPSKQGTGPSGQVLKLVLRDAETEPVLVNLRKDPRFQELLKVAKNGR